MHRFSPTVEATAADTLTEPSWASGLRRNDAATVRALYQQHFPVIRQYVMSNSGTSDDAQDIFQEAMTVLWLKAKEGALPAGSEPGAFLYQVAKNKWLDVVRSAAHKHMKVIHDDRKLDVRAEAPDDTEEKLLRLREVYGKLDEKCRTVLDQFYFERKDLVTIAAGMGVEEESIRTIKYRCMMKLRASRKAIAGEELTDES
ncbi:MAG: sigma-70 family RNA polymerase sigma factor [Flavobacteriales bacterium]|nr:sigma-70 family RNA polymerase sigma factor [Flavobacteriales bacterium]